MSVALIGTPRTTAISIRSSVALKHRYLPKNGNNMGNNDFLEVKVCNCVVTYGGKQENADVVLGYLSDGPECSMYMALQLPQYTDGLLTYDADELYKTDMWYESRSDANFQTDLPELINRFLSNITPYNVLSVTPV
jgi:hypothetical protein